MLYFFAIDMMIYLALTYSLSRSLGAIFLYSAISGLWSFGQQPSHHHRKLKLSAKFTFLNSIFTAMTIIASFIINEPHTLTMCQALLISKRTLFLNSVRNESINSVNYRERVKRQTNRFWSLHGPTNLGRLAVVWLRRSRRPSCGQWDWSHDSGFFSFMHLLRSDKIWMEVWDRTPSVELYFNL